MINFKEKIKVFIQEESILPQLKLWSQSHTLPGLHNISLFDIGSAFLAHLEKANIRLKASAITFNFILAFFPFTIFLLTLLPYFQLDNAIDVLKSSVTGLMPMNVENIVFGLIVDTIRPRSGLLSIGFLMAVFFASNGMMSLMNAFRDSTIGTFKEQSWWGLRLRALFLTFLMILLLVTSSITFVLARLILNILEKYVTIDAITTGMLLSARWLPVILLIYLLFFIIYRIGPSLRKKIPFFAYGTLLATVLCIIVSLIISYFVNNFANYNRIYGSLGTIVALMIWLQANMMIILYGYELNLVIVDYKANKIKPLSQ